VSVVDDIKLALLGDKEAAKRLTDAGVLLPCPFCKGEVRRVIGFGGLNFFRCRKCGAVVSFDNDYYNAHKDEAITAWNTRAPILSAEELQRLEAKP
ncbi:Lar family restriction alleviation protein, partial [Flavonifractor plautii]|uniref:Lar family restriction alleviation protein n=1 Tax=Flavonifractor plautii TaxID=292800 RepID=UPI0024BA9086